MAVFPFGDARDWFSEKRFGLFIHWGLYALSEWHEQDQWRRRIPRTQYERLMHQFNPTRFDPDAWLDVAQAAGMEYICFTVGHGADGLQHHAHAVWQGHAANAGGCVP
jgi:alpha-L-fucosidase